MSIWNVTRTGNGQYEVPEFARSGLGLADLAAYIREGNEIEVTDGSGEDITKQSLVDIAFSVSNEPETSRGREKLMQLDEFRLHQIIEDDEISDTLSE